MTGAMSRRPFGRIIFCIVSAASLQGAGGFGNRETTGRALQPAAGALVGPGHPDLGARKRRFTVQNQALREMLYPRIRG